MTPPRVEEFRHLLGDLDGDVDLGLGGRGAEMRASRPGRALPNSGLALAGSSTNTSSAAPATWPLSSAVLERRLVDQAAARAIDDPDALLGLRQILAREDVAGLIGERRVEGDEIGAGEQVVELDLLDSEVQRPLGGQERIVGDHLHPQAERPVGDDRADIAGADQAERLAGQLDPHEAVLLPFAGLGRGIGGRAGRGPARTSRRWHARRW